MKNNNVFLLTIVSCLLFGTLSAMDKQPKSISEKNEPSIALESNAGNSDIQSKSLTCPVCNNPFSTKQSLNRHIETIHNKKKDFICTICKQSFTQKSSLDTHISTVHEGKREFICKICLYPFSQKSNLKTHINRKHEGKITSSKRKPTSSLDNSSHKSKKAKKEKKADNSDSDSSEAMIIEKPQQEQDGSGQASPMELIAQAKKLQPTAQQSSAASGSATGSSAAASASSATSSLAPAAASAIVNTAQAAQENTPAAQQTNEIKRVTCCECKQKIELPSFKKHLEDHTQCEANERNQTALIMLFKSVAPTNNVPSSAAAQASASTAAPVMPSTSLPQYPKPNAMTYQAVTK